jgi:peptide deformylase
MLYKGRLIMLELVSPKNALKLCKDVENPEILAELGGKKLVNDMIKLCIRENGIGLAAPQIGIHYKFFITFLQEFQDWKLFINAKYRPLNQQMVDSVEGCLTHGKDNTYKVKRYTKILAEWDEIDSAGDFQERKREMTGISAIIFQHEVDHLNSITVSSQGTKINLKKEE